MSLSAAVIAVLVEKGMSASDILDVARASEAKADPTNAERQARFRANKKANTDSNAVTVTPVTPSPNERDILTPTRESKTDPKGSSKSREQRALIGNCLKRAFPPPEGVTAEQWQAFCGQRKKKLNDRSYALLTNKLIALAEAGWPPGEMIDLATERGWETVFAPRNFTNDRSNANPLSEAVTRILSNG